MSTALKVVTLQLFQIKGNLLKTYTYRCLEKLRQFL